MKSLFLAATAAAVVVPASAQAVTIVNGSFESASVDPGAGFTTLGLGSTAITGWTVGGAGVDYIGGYWQAADGQRSVDLSAGGPGSISQELTGLTIGQRYIIRFALAGNPDGGSSTKLALVQGAPGGIVGFENFVVPAGTSRSNMNWSNRSYEFFAGATTATLTFTSGENNPYGPALDNVSIGVPEPATWALMILGFGAVGGAMRRRSARKLAIA